jgi:hypothetical protein
MRRRQLSSVLARVIPACAVFAFFVLTPTAGWAQATACALLSETEISEIMGAPVPVGVEFAGPEVCRWSNDEPPITSVLLMVRSAGTIREQVLCGDLRQGLGEGEPLDGLTDVALWRFSSTLGLFNSAELETCGPPGYVSLTLNSEQDEATLKAATLALFSSSVAALTAPQPGE